MRHHPDRQGVEGRQPRQLGQGVLQVGLGVEDGGGDVVLEVAWGIGHHTLLSDTGSPRSVPLSSARVARMPAVSIQNALLPFSADEGFGFATSSSKRLTIASLLLA